MNRDAGVSFSQACASCRHQRKRCDDKCELAPYFPASRYNEFLNAHKLFGVSNIQKIMNSVEPHQKKATAESILKEGNARRFDPVHGCLGIIRHLMSQIEFYEKDLHLVNQQIEFFREKEQQKLLLGKDEENFPAASSSFLTSFRLKHEFDASNNYQPGTEGTGVFDNRLNYQSTSDGDAIVKDLDIQSTYKILESYRNKHVIENIKEPGESSSVSMAKGKEAMIRPSDNEKAD